MPRKCGRPPKSAKPMDAKQKLIDATVAIIKREGADAVTVRSVVEESGLSIGTFYHHFKNKDELLMYFVKETSFDSFELTTPLEQLPDRICELYFYLINRYMELGEDFMKSYIPRAIRHCPLICVRKMADSRMVPLWRDVKGRLRMPLPRIYWIKRQTPMY